MDTRKALINGTILKFYNHSNGLTVYTVNKEIARGGSCIVYDASYTNNAGSSKTVRIKECYPFKLNISRDQSDFLIAPTAQSAEFEKCKDKMKNSFNICNDLFSTDKLTNSISNTLDIYEANNTVYIVSTYSQGEELANKKINTLKECITIISSTAKTIKKIHDKGYLYLDIKPENVFCLYDTAEIIHLFDFDSLIPLSDHPIKQNISVKISYTKGFAALELQTGNLKKIGKHTDVYGIGALLFYLIFGHAPSALDCESDAAYNYSESVFPTDKYNDKVFGMLTEFFHNTLANYYLDRYNDMEQVILHLDEIKKYADLSVPFIYSTKMSRLKFFIGRADEMHSLNQWLNQNERNCMIITGMGGIGKSSLIREYLSVMDSCFDNILYVNYKESIQRTITDDEQIKINNIQKDDNESIYEYFIRKLNIIRKLILNKHTVIVIDNYNGEFKAELNEILKLDWKIIIITRSKSLVQNFDTLHLNAIQDRQELYKMFSYYIKREIDKNEYVYVDNIISKVFGHTLILELISKQISISYLSISEASDIIDRYGFSSIAPEKVDYIKDNYMYHETINNIVNVLFESSDLSPTQKIILNTLSLFGMSKTNIRIFSEMLELHSKDDINKLISDGWINIEHNNIFMHPVIIETIRQWQWTDEFIAAALKIINAIFKKIKPINTNQGLQNPESHKKLELYIQYSENILESCQDNKIICTSKIYQELLYNTIINMPRDRENYIVEKSAELLINYDVLSKNNIIDLYDKVISIYEEKKDLENAWILIKQAKSFTKNCKDNTISGLYYDILAGFYDTKLNGFYDTQSSKDKVNLKNLIGSLNKAIHYLKKSNTNDGRYSLCECIVSKAIVLIRSCPKHTRKIHSLLILSDKIIKNFFPNNSNILFSYNMACAWYYTISEPEEKLTYTFIDNACKAAENTYYSDLDFIDSIIIPRANIDLEWQKYDSAAQQIISAIDICKNHNGVIPYIRKKKDLYNCLLDIYSFSQDSEKYKAIIEQIENEN